MRSQNPLIRLLNGEDITVTLPGGGTTVVYLMDFALELAGCQDPAITPALVAARTAYGKELQPIHAFCYLPYAEGVGIAQYYDRIHIDGINNRDELHASLKQELHPDISIPQLDLFAKVICTGIMLSGLGRLVDPVSEALQELQKQYPAYKEFVDLSRDAESEKPDFFFVMNFISQSQIRQTADEEIIRSFVEELASLIEAPDVRRCGEEYEFLPEMAGRDFLKEVVSHIQKMNQSEGILRFMEMAQTDPQLRTIIEESQMESFTSKLVQSGQRSVVNQIVGLTTRAMRFETPIQDYVGGLKEILAAGRQSYANLGQRLGPEIP